MSRPTNGFKETALGPLPVEWEVVRLGEIAETTSGGTPSRKKSGYFGGVIPWIKSGELEDGSISKAEEYITEDGLSASNAKLFPPGTLLIALYGATAGKVGILTIEAASNQAVCAVFPKNQSFLSEFMMYCFMHRREELLKERYGGAQPNISQRTLRIFPIPLPPLSEQRGIARALNAVQREIAAQEQLIAAAREVKRALMARLFTYGPGAEPARTKETEIGEVPKHWEVVRLGEVTEKPQYGYTATAVNEPVGLQFLRITDIQDGQVDWSTVPYCEISEEQSKQYYLKPGDILIARIGATTGKSYRIAQSPPAVFASYLIRLRAKSGVSDKFLAHFTNSTVYWTQINASKGGRLKQGVNGPVLKSLHLPLPPVPEQEVIARILSAADRKITAEEQRKAALRAVFKSLLGELMTGRVRVSE